MKDQKQKLRNEQTQADQTENEVRPDCTCVSDPFASLPPESRPRPKNTMGGLRKVTCPKCGLQYWTNRKSDLSIDCEKSGVRISEAEGTQCD